MLGWIALHRSIQDHWVWKDPKRLKWWIDLLLMANHKENKILVNGVLTTIERGERLTSEQILADRWEVSRNTVRKFLKLLEDDGMISVEKSRQTGTTYKVLNYSLYQTINGDKKQRNEQQKDNELNNELNINNNDNNDNNDKQKERRNSSKLKYADISLLTDFQEVENKEVEKLENSSSGNNKQNTLIDDFDKLWKLYPNKKGKAAAFKAYKKAIKDGAENKDIQDGIVAYSKYVQVNNTPKEYVKHGSTYFNNRTWEDDYTASNQATNQSSAVEPFGEDYRVELYGMTKEEMVERQEKEEQKIEQENFET